MTNRFHKLELEDSLQPVANSSVTRSTSSAHSTSQIQPDLHDSRYWMGQAMQNRRIGNHEEALRYYSRAVELDRSMVSGWVGQVQMLIALAEYPEAELWARKALELFRNHADLLAGRAQALCRNGDLKSAQASCDAALSQPGNSAYCWVTRGELMLARKDNVEQHCFDKAVQLDPDWLVLVEIASIYIFYSRNAKALARCRQAVEKAPDQPYCWFKQGCCERAMGLTDAAKRSFKQCLDLQPKHSQARMQLMEIEASGRTVRGALRRLFGRG